MATVPDAGIITAGRLDAWRLLGAVGAGAGMLAGKAAAAAAGAAANAPAPFMPMVAECATCLPSCCSAGWLGAESVEGFGAGEAEAGSREACAAGCSAGFCCARRGCSAPAAEAEAMPSRTTSAGVGGGGGARVAVRRLSSRVTFGVRVKPVAPGTYAAKDRPSSIIRDALSPLAPGLRARCDVRTGGVSRC